MKVRRATAADHRSLCITAMRAFQDDPVMRWLFPDDEEYFHPDGAVMASPMSGWLRLGEVWCTDDGVGVAVWIPPGRPDIPPPPDGDAGLDEVPDDRLERFGIIGALMAAHTPTEEHWYLQLLGTHPDWQRQGIAAALMAEMFERADADGIPCYLETETVANVAYYRRHGFEVVSEFDIPTGEHLHRFSSWDGDPATEVGPHMWGMLRPAR